MMTIHAPGGVQEDFAPDVSVVALPAASTREKDPTRWLCLATLVAAFVVAYFRVAGLPEQATFALTQADAPARAPAHAKPRYREVFVSSGVTPSTHSATAVEGADGRLRAFWFGGTREGARDTSIYMSVQTAQGWTAETPVVVRENLQRQLGRYIAKIGNPVVMRDARGGLRLFFVTVSVGGWAGSAINVIASHDDGKTWTPAKRLVTSPFFNISTLVKNSPVAFADGGYGLPVYHEFLGKFAEFLRFDDEGGLVDKQRLSWGRHSLQPAIVAHSPTNALGFMRYAGEAPGRILMFHGDGSGRTWDAPKKIALPNPNSAVSALALADGGLLLAFNNSDDSRAVLSLAHSADAGKTWRVIHDFERAANDDKEFSYPWLMRAHDGQYHLFYTWTRKRIKHVAFNAAWLGKKLR